MPKSLFLHASLLVAAAALCMAQTSSTATTFTATLDGYQYPNGSTVNNVAVNKATATFRVFLHSTTDMRFDFTPSYPANYTLTGVTLYRGSPGALDPLIYTGRVCFADSTYCYDLVNYAPDPRAGLPVYPLCGNSTYIRVRITCSPTGYVNTNGGDLQGSDINWDPFSVTNTNVPVGSPVANTAALLDLMRHNLVYIQARFSVVTGDATLGTRVVFIRGQLTPAP